MIHHNEMLRKITKLLTVSPATLLILLSCATVDVLGKGHIDFGYSGPHGPDHWAEDYDTCFGKHQSPINIEEHDVREVNFPPITFFDLDSPRKVFLSNNGHTAMVHTSNDSRPATMTGGPLKGNYAFEQLHFHWGENDREGSEDLINNHSFAMELHAVFYKDDYGSMNNAVRYSDGLAVLAFFFEVDSNDKANEMFHSLVEFLPKVEKVGTEIQLPESLRLKHLIDPAGPSDDKKQNYFTYNGSLTTPPCSEVVTWVDFKYPLKLSHSQIAAFRDISSSEGHKLTHNFRPVQPLADRSVLLNVPNNFVPTTTSTSFIEKANEIQSDQEPSSASMLQFDFVLSLSAAVCLNVFFHSYHSR